MTTEKDQAEQLTRYLLDKSTYGNRTSPLEDMVRTRITDMARDIAGQVIAENPDLAETIRTRTRTVLAAALRDDNWLNKTITGSIVKALTDHALSED